MFNPLGDPELKKIISIEILNLQKRLLEKEYIVEFHSSVEDRVLGLNTEENYGARPVKRIIQNLCEDFLSDEILKGNILPKIPITIKYDKKGELFIE